MSVCIGEKIEDFKVLTLLGKGSFACVYRAKSVNTGLEVAIKMIDKKAMHKVGMIQRVRNEVEIHCQLKHPSILELYNYFEDDNYVYLVLEMCHNGEMSRYLKNRKNAFTEEEARNFMHQTVTGMLYLHSHGILHRDLTLSNLLLTSNMNIKIADFGLATQLRMPNEKHFTMCGTPNYISPEIATRSAHGLESDVWSLGCMFYTFLVGRPPFDTDAVKTTLNKVVLADYKMPSFVSQEARDLIYSLLRKNPADRISLSSVLDHPFMTKNSLFRRGPNSVEDSLDSGHATISTAFTGATTSSSSTSSRLPERTKQLVSQALPNKFSVFPAQVKKPGSASSLDSDCSTERGRQLTSKRETVRGRNMHNTEEEESRPHSRYLRRAHSSDLSSTTHSQTQGNTNIERCHSVEVLTKSIHSGIVGNEEPFSSVTIYSENPQELLERQTSPPVREKAKLDFELGLRPGYLLRDQDSHSGMIHKWLGNLENADLQQGQFKDSSSNSTGGSFHNGQLVSTVTDNLSVNAWAEQVRQCNANLYGTDHSVKSGTYGRCDQVLPLTEVVQSRSGFGYRCITEQNGTMTREPQQTAFTAPSLGSIVSPLSAHRLKPVRQKTKNAVVSILDTGEVCMEFLKVHNSQERVREVLRISYDGRTITAYNPNEGKGFPLDERPPSPPENVFIYSFDSLPEKYWKKYQYACKFVQLVKSKTPKVTLYTKYAKCMLMENGPEADIEVCFYDGAKIHKTSEFLRVIETSGKSYTLKGQGSVSSLSEGARIYVAHANESHRTCLVLESVITAEEEKSEQHTAFFPIIVGRRPPSSAFSKASSEVCTTAVKKGLDMDQPSESKEENEMTPQLSQVLKSVFVENVGWASQLTSGAVWVQFNDGSQLLVKAGVSSVIYTSPHGQTFRFGEKEKIPEYVKEKLKCLSSILILFATPTNHH